MEDYDKSSMVWHLVTLYLFTWIREPAVWGNYDQLDGSIMRTKNRCFDNILQKRQHFVRTKKACWKCTSIMDSSEPRPWLSLTNHPERVTLCHTFCLIEHHLPPLHILLDPPCRMTLFLYMNLRIPPPSFQNPQPLTWRMNANRNMRR